MRNELTYSQKECVSANKYLYNGKELQDESLGGVNLDWYDYGSRFMDPQIGRWTTVDPLSENRPFNSPFSFCSNNPLIYIDPNGKDYVVYIDHNKHTITVSATYYTKNGDEGALKSANEAVNVWNSQNGKFNYRVGKGDAAVNYSINFDLQVKQVEDPIGTANADKRSWVSDAEKTTPDGSSNVYGIVPDDYTSTHGTTSGGNLVKVEQSDAQGTVGAHEVGHTLGLDHSTSGVMTEGINHPEHSSSISNWNVKDIIKGASKPGNIGRTENTGTKPDDFYKGKVKYEEH